MVEAFKTDVQKKAQSKMLLCILSEASLRLKLILTFQIVIRCLELKETIWRR